MTSYWKPGDKVVVRSVWDGRVRAAWPDTVVRDSDQLLALYLAKGTRFKRTDRRMPVGDWSLIDDIWTADMLLLVTPSDAYSVLLFWDANQTLSSWYVNLQAPFERTPIGIDFVDHFLDIIIRPDLSSWEWKDEDELQEATQLGLLSQPMADQIRQEGERVIGQVKTGGPIPGGQFQNFRPSGKLDRFMIAVSSMYPDQVTDNPPIVLIHGAANSAKVWTVWQQELAALGWTSHAIELRGHGQSPPFDLSDTTMEDYASDVAGFAKHLSQQPVVMGWSMGGLVGMMVASQGRGMACVALAPSVPARQLDTSVDLRTGEIGPEEYGIVDGDINNQPAMQDLDSEERSLSLSSLSSESRLARDQRRQGIVIESLPCPFLIVTGTDDKAWPKKRYEGLWLNADFYEVEEASHWGLVLNRRALAVGIPEVLRWIHTKLI